MGFEHYIFVGREKLRCGYTTGTCAAAAARGAAELLLRGSCLPSVVVDTPAGIPVEVELLDLQSGPGWASCAVRKDGGDDADATHGTLICARVEDRADPGVAVDGGTGVGRVTRPGLDQAVGNAAINSVPRKMIGEQLRAALVGADHPGGLLAVISAPEGERLAQKTFNPRLGIVGGISILGTSGIVRPMSEASLIASIHLEMDQHRANGARHLVLAPGNYGEDFCRRELGLELKNWATCSNYVGDAIDHAAGTGFESVLLVGHLGKLCKVAAGNMNTHSRISDARRETLCTHTALSGGGAATVRAVFDAPTTDAALEVLDEAGIREPVLGSLTDALEEKLKFRAGPDLEIAAIIFTNRLGVVGKTSRADALLARHGAQTEEKEKNL